VGDVIPGVLAGINEDIDSAPVRLKKQAEEGGESYKKEEK